MLHLNGPDYFEDLHIHPLHTDLFTPQRVLAHPWNIPMFNRTLTSSIRVHVPASYVSLPEYMLVNKQPPTVALGKSESMKALVVGGVKQFEIYAQGKL